MTELLIPLVNKLQKVTATLEQELDLPQLVVIGGQSSGKSSVLEALVGRNFLPRGTGIVTRRPLVLQLNKAPEGENAEYGEFAHQPGKVYADFDAIRNEIEAETDRVTGRNKGISAKPIILQITSPHVLPLTLVDTPGIARVPVGDQPRDIEAQIRNLVLEYITKPGAIILAVQPANQDLATSDALKLAADVDPAGHRTIGVLTKLDLMDAGTDALDIMLGKVVPLKLGIVGVVNRSQADVVASKSVAAGLSAEAAFFANHPKYGPIAESCGTAYLAAKCSTLLGKHIRRTIPKLKSQITGLHAETLAELESFGTEPYSGREGKRVFVLQILNKISKTFADQVDGHTHSATRENTLTTDELNSGARIRYVFQNVLADALDDIQVELSTADIRTAIKNAAGTAPALFVPEAAFELLIRTQIARLGEPLLHAADLVHNELLRALSSLDLPELERFSHLKDSSSEVAADLLRSCMRPTRKMLSNLVDCELSYINTNHPDFTRGPELLANSDSTVDDYEPAPRAAPSRPVHSSSSESSGPASFLWSLFSSGSDESSRATDARGTASRSPPEVLRVDGKLSRMETVQVNLILRLLDSYLGIVKKNLHDMGSKAIMHFLVQNAKDNMQRALVSNLYKDELTERLLREDQRVVKHRAALEHKLEVLEDANDLLQMAEIHHLDLDDEWDPLTDAGSHHTSGSHRSRRRSLGSSAMGARGRRDDDDEYRPRSRW
ncbi:dynamin-A [Thecamonas trahens ATCC 50062]|uniref:Dynamin-A n=1 Tax=Thecamonas trahens ATCC 50062 TaxID=461836 RepID=A0A0L0DF81_THETB|nr:dynamin-A [Thecamonas trahens ATCC 50062]KNC50880.1 dynamin-A [Thecamonas trahens ATCC 50062]|eukprot:XP_013756587.1 dynamin-A [Thecamonas trahens ATCC 50062]